jgi:SEC-C motif domain protein
MAENLKSEKFLLCPCCSEKLYSECCQRYHQGEAPKTPLELMRSRYSAYALGLAEYLIETTHPQNPGIVSDKNQWLNRIRDFSNQVEFHGLEILDEEASEAEGFVTFVAHLSQNGEDMTFTERSRFLKHNNVWKYVDGKIGKGKVTAAQMRALN